MSNATFVPRVVIQCGREGVAPVICVPGSGASVTAFCDLAEELGADIPVHGLQARGLDDQSIPFPDVETATECFVAALQPLTSARCHIVGHSFGGWIAFELALRLQRLGASVATLMILDSRVPAVAGAPRDVRTRLMNLLQLIGLFELRIERGLGISAHDLMGLTEEQQFEFLFARLCRAGILSPQSGRSVLRGTVRVFETNANTHYVPGGVFRGSLHFVRARSAAGRAREEICGPTVGWEALASRVMFEVSTGNHVTLLHRPHVALIADCLRRQVLRQRTGVGSTQCASPDVAWSEPGPRGA